MKWQKENDGGKLTDSVMGVNICRATTVVLYGLRSGCIDAPYVIRQIFNTGRLSFLKGV